MPNDRLWTDDEIEELLKMWPYHSASQIGEVIKRTRNAIIGKINRLRHAGIAAANYDNKIYIDPPARTPRLPKPRERPVMEIVEQPPAAPAPAVVPTSGACNIYELNGHRCHYPLGDLYEPGPAVLFCGAPAVDGRPYCLHHCRVSYQGFGGYPVQHIPGREAGTG